MAGLLLTDPPDPVVARQESVGEDRAVVAELDRPHAIRGPAQGDVHGSSLVDADVICGVVSPQSSRTSSYSKSERSPGSFSVTPVARNPCRS